MDNAMMNLAGREVTCWSDDLFPWHAIVLKGRTGSLPIRRVKAGLGSGEGRPRTEARATSRPLTPSHFSSLLFTCALIGESICWGTMWLSCHKMLACLCSPTGSMGVHGRDVVALCAAVATAGICWPVHLGGARSSDGPSEEIRYVPLPPITVEISPLDWRSELRRVRTE